MLFAVAAMDPTVRMLFFAAALICFGLTTFGVAVGRVSLLALGLASFTIPWFWDALAQT